jgi:hypothetical protein
MRAASAIAFERNDRPFRINPVILSIPGLLDDSRGFSFCSSPRNAGAVAELRAPRIP